ncbi:hypothetical protein CFC21_065310 [Triticum aestivum]|uniref:Uncharacterized protein n=1 Tax=Triticum aestivum TaxID=4565 RepID=A0A9R1H2L0_WHEAT|nr:hypothetical protein CFC21_065310 [Triticum aestivum]
MPCCHWVLSVAESSSNNKTPSWLHRLHTKGGLSFPSHLQIDDLLYGRIQPPPPSPPPPVPPPPPPSDRDAAATNPQDPLSGVISEIFAVPSAPRSNRSLKPFRKQYRPRPRPNVKSANKDDKDKAKARKRRRADRDAGAEHGERRSRTEVTVIDTSTDGWKAAKVLVRRGANWKISDRKHSEISETEDLSKGKRRAGLVAKVLRDKKKGKGAALPGNIHPSSGILIKVPDDAAIEAPKRPRSCEPVPIAQSAPILQLPSSSTCSQP